MGKIFNHCSNVLIPDNGSKEGRYAKLLVDVDLTKSLLRGTKIRCNDELRWISFKYKQLPFFCFYCGKIGHRERVCELKMLDARNSCVDEGQYGEWLRGLNLKSPTKVTGLGGRDQSTSSGITQNTTTVGRKQMRMGENGGEVRDQG